MTEPNRTPHRLVRTTLSLTVGALCALVAFPGCAFRDAGSQPIGPAGRPPDSRVTQPAPPLRTDPPSDDVANTTQEEASAKAKRELSSVSLRLEANRVLDDWHEAASVGARARYIEHFSPDAVFLGTDKTERWDLATFTSYVDEHFRPGRGWSYTPSQRYVILGPDLRVAWFDEALDSAGYGALRGTGVLRRDGDTWRIAHYSMTFTIPNDVAGDVVDVVRSAGGQ